MRMEEIKECSSDTDPTDDKDGEEDKQDEMDSSKRSCNISKQRIGMLIRESQARNILECGSESSYGGCNFDKM